MHRIIFIIVLSLTLASCSVVRETAEPVAREKTPAERVDSVLMASAGELAGIGMGDFLRCIDVVLDKAEPASTGRTISIFKDGHPILSILFGADETPSFIFGVTFGGKVTFETDPVILVWNLYDYVKACIECRTEDDVAALVESFNSLYKVNVLLEGNSVGVLRMKAWEKDGLLTPAFVIDYHDGASCYLQLTF